MKLETPTLGGINPWAQCTYLITSWFRLSSSRSSIKRGCLFLLRFYDNESNNILSDAGWPGALLDLQREEDESHDKLWTERSLCWSRAFRRIRKHCCVFCRELRLIWFLFSVASHCEIIQTVASHTTRIASILLHSGMKMLRHFP